MFHLRNSLDLIIRRKGRPTNTPDATFHKFQVSFKNECIRVFSKCATIYLVTRRHKGPFTLAIFAAILDSSVISRRFQSPL